VLEKRSLFREMKITVLLFHETRFCPVRKTAKQVKRRPPVLRNNEAHFVKHFSKPFRQKLREEFDSESRLKENVAHFSFWTVQSRTLPSTIYKPQC
jgi:hypothetical protein